jgi:hypothetical protein
MNLGLSVSGRALRGSPGLVAGLGYGSFQGLRTVGGVGMDVLE